MLIILPETSDRLTAVSVSAGFTSADFTVYKSLINQQMVKNGVANVYFEMQEFKGWEPVAFLKNASFDIIHGHEFGKVAMIEANGGNNTLQGWPGWLKKMESGISRWKKENSL